MKRTLFILNVLAYLALATTLNSQVLPITPDSLNLAVLVVDYDSYIFEGGNMSYYEKCTCSPDSLPFVPLYIPPGDFGSMAFALSHTGDTIFDATIVWMGMGGILYPSEFSMQWPFQYQDLTMIQPQLEYFDLTGQKTNDPVFMQKADSAWDAVDSLIITSFFADYNYKAGIYMYPPTVGMFDPTVAKWIVFLYYSEVVYSTFQGNSREALQVFPNPCSDRLTLSLDGNNFNNCTLEIFNLDGQSMSISHPISGQDATLNLSSLAPGVYLLRANMQGRTATSKFIKL